MKNTYIDTIKKCTTWAEIMEAVIAASAENALTDEVAAQFKKSYDVVKDVHRYRRGDEYISETKETADEMLNIVKTVADCNGLTMETVGRFLWTGGTQKPYAKILKSLGFTYQSNKKKWCKSYKGYVRRGGKKQFSYAQIKRKYGFGETEETV